MNDMVDNVPLEQYEGESYAEHLRELLKLIDVKSIELTQAYIYGKENRDAHYQLISLLRQAYLDLAPKVVNNPNLARKFKLWTKVADDPTLLLQPQYEKLVWSWQMTIREAYEHLGLTNIG